MFWEQENDALNSAVSNWMAQNCFDKILRYFLLVDNFNLGENVSVPKVTPSYGLLKKKFAEALINNLINNFVWMDLCYLIMGDIWPNSTSKEILSNFVIRLQGFSWKFGSM